MKYVIIGGVAAGASAAARLRRLDEQAEIVLLEKGSDISYANCGLPYHVGGVIAARARLSVMPPAKFASWFNVDVRTNCEATAIDRAKKEVEVRTADGSSRLAYDKLLIATGATPVGDAYTDATHPHVAHLWTLADMDRVMAKLGATRRVLVVGAGFVGLELAENLRHRGLAVTVVQRGGHVLPTMDAEMSEPLADELRGAGIDLRFGRIVSDFVEKPDGVEAVLDDGTRLAVDLAVVSTGVRPRSELAKSAGLEIGPRGHIVVDEGLHTSDPDIFAEIICDKNGIHVDPDIIKMVVRTKGVERIILITDSMTSRDNYKNAPEIGYGPDLNYDDIGYLAGSRLTLENACQNMMKHTGYGLCHAIRFATINPARMLGIDHKVGSLEPGKLANIILIDDMVHIDTVILQGDVMVRNA